MRDRPHVIEVTYGCFRATRDGRVGLTRNWPASLGWVRHRARRRGLAGRVGERIWWFAVRRCQ